MAVYYIHASTKGQQSIFIFSKKYSATSVEPGSASTDGGQCCDLLFSAKLAIKLVLMEQFFLLVKVF
jgi:hypothetical protein